jgi:hypothetical protein
MYDGNRETAPERSAHDFPLLNPAGKLFYSGARLQLNIVTDPLSWAGLFKSQSGSTGTVAGNPRRRSHRERQNQPPK